MRPSAMHAREGGGERVLEAGSPSWGVVVVISIMILPYILDVFGLQCPSPFPRPPFRASLLASKGIDFFSNEVTLHSSSDDDSGDGGAPAPAKFAKPCPEVSNGALGGLFENIMDGVHSVQPHQAPLPLSLFLSHTPLWWPSCHSCLVPVRVT